MKWKSVTALVIGMIIPVTMVSSEDEDVRAVRAKIVSSGLTASSENQWAEAAIPFRSGQYREELDVSVAGSIYHSNLLAYDLSAQLGLMQYADTNVELDILSPVLTADIHLLTTWLKAKPLFFTLYGDHGEDIQDVDFFEQSRIRESALGWIGQWNNRIAPLQLSARGSHSVEDRESYRSDTREVTLSGGLTNTSSDGRSRLRTEYAYSDFTREIVGVSQTSGQSHDVRLAHSLDFGSDHQLSSSLYFMGLDGTVDSTVFDISERLELSLPLNLSGGIFYSLYSTGTDSLENLTNRGTIQLSHQLYDSLATTLKGTGSITASDQYREWNTGTAMDLAYRKKISVGYLYINYGIGGKFSSQSATGSTLQVLDESHILTDGSVTFLENSNVDISTIVVTNDTGLLVYASGVDYQAVPIGGRTQIIRVASGAITNGSEVLVDYHASAGANLDVVNVSQVAETRVTLFNDVLTLFVRYNRERFPGAGLAEEATLELMDRLVTGLNADYGPFFISGEYEHAGSSQSPFDALRFMQHMALPLARQSSIALQGSQSMILFRDQESSQGQVDLQTEYTIALGSYVNGALGAGMRVILDGTPPSSVHWKANAGLRFQRGLISGNVEYTLDAEPPTDALHTVRLFLRKEF